MQKIKEEMKSGFATAFLNSCENSSVAYRPQFISNNRIEGKKVLVSIEDELKCCKEFFISVAFITMSGITPLLQIFKELEQRGIKGRILTTNYLNFSEPRALRKLAQLDNIKLRLFRVDNGNEGFHTKGYIFKNEEIYRIIIGSSNMTLNALTLNKEWNIKVVSTEQGEFVGQLLEEYNDLWKKSDNLSNYIETYTRIYEAQKRVNKQSKVANIQQYKLQPNQMQLEFVHNLVKIKEKNETRAMLISSTGTGKTYASAFAVREMRPKRILFLVHREQIAKQAMRSYQNIFGNTKLFQLLSGNSQDFEKILKADFVFSTIQMMSKQEIMNKFQRDVFSMIIIDEVHRAGSQSYQKVMEYFQPELWLGMTASPIRTDGFDIYSLFDHNIAYEIHLQQALEENLLCPFHYFGITELSIDGITIDDEHMDDFNLLTCDQRVDYVMNQATYYGYSGESVQGLIFCSSKKEAKMLSEKFNQRGWRTIALVGDDSQETREDAIERLVNGQGDMKLDYLITVDIFNEGVDIPEINQVIMLRATQSPTIFIQQLGRGLRKFEGKEYVVVLDFIGNYKNNFMIPVALSGDRTYNKDTIRKYVAEGNRVIPGASTIHFDEISKKKIFKAIDEANFNDVKLIRDSYKQLKYKLGRIPTLMDFENYGEIDVQRIFDNKSLGSYYKFLVKYEKEYNVYLNEQQEKVIEFISKKFASGKRIHELILLKRLLKYEHGIIGALRRELKEYKIKVTDKTEKNIINVMTNNFTVGTGKGTYKDCIFIEKEQEDYIISESFKQMLQDKEFHLMVEELIDYGIMKNQKYYADVYKDSNFQLYSKYTYDDVCRLLEWEKGEVTLNIGGYKYDKNTKTYPIFINYEKEEGIQDTVRYEDRFINESTLIAISKSGRNLSSEDVCTALNAEQLGVQMELFVRKNKDDKISKEFYYLGRVRATGNAKEFIMPNTTKTAVEIEYQLLTPVREDIFKYITK